MNAAVLREPAPVQENPLTIEEVAMPEAGSDSTLLKVLAYALCRTDLHIVEGELPPKLP
jgi:propanol-preferring alcohol dehydrogenase